MGKDVLTFFVYVFLTNTFHFLQKCKVNSVYQSRGIQITKQKQSMYIVHIKPLLFSIWAIQWKEHNSANQ